MKAPQAPHLDERRTSEFFAELGDRAQAWIPSWGLADGEHDFGRALLQIAARFNSEVAERLDGAGEKMRRGLLDWLGVPRKAARPARLPVVFKMADSAIEAVLATAPVQIQADANGTQVVFETETDVRVVPGFLDVVVGADADNDAFYLTPPGVSDLQPIQPLPTQWRLKSFAAADATKLQLDPEMGLAAEMILGTDKQQYKIIKADKDIVTIEPPLVTGLAEFTVLSKVTTFSPFGGQARNWQEHALYLGDEELLNIEAAATIEVVGAVGLRDGFTWEYSGKRNANDPVEWLPFKFDDNRQKTVTNAIVLVKDKGAIELTQVDGKNSRWIRASTQHVDPASSPFTSDEFSIRVNSSGCDDRLPCPPQVATASPAAEAMANTTPLVLENVFYPLGKEPRQFDAFYLGSQEAFSKQGAEVQLCFELAQSSFAALSSLRTAPQPDQFLAGVAADGFLHLFSFEPGTGVITRYPNREPLRPPSPGPAGATIRSQAIALDPAPGFRAPIWVVGADIFIAVSAGNAVWIWHENTGNPSVSGWEPAGTINLGDPSKGIDGLVYLADGPVGRLFALGNSKLFVRNLNALNPTWEEVEKQGGGAEVALKKIAPINVQNGALGPGPLANGIIGVDETKLYRITFNSIPLQARYEMLLDNVGSDLTPAAVRRNDNSLVVVAVGPEQSDTDRELLALHIQQGELGKEDTKSVSLNSKNIVGHSIDVNQNGNQLTFVTCSQIPGESASLAAWTPFDPGTPAVLFSTKMPTYVGMPNGAPTLLSQHVIVPTTSSHVLVAPFAVSQRLSTQVPLETAVIASEEADLLQAGDSIYLPFEENGKTKYHTELFSGTGEVARGQTLYEFSLESKNAPFFVSRASETPFQGSMAAEATDQLILDSGDSNTQKGSPLLITTDRSTELYHVELFDPATKVATLDRILLVDDPIQPIKYRLARETGARLRPLLRLAPATSGNWDAALLDRVDLVFPHADPTFQPGIAFKTDSSNHPELVALSEPWTVPPSHVGAGSDVQFLIDASVGNWSVQLGDTSTNPELSWEYWNGKGWWKLNVAREETQHLKTTGRVEFKVPSDIASSDWAGKTNFWIRARLIGGDYGREKVTVITKPVADGTEQTIERSTEGIRAPSVVGLYISYRVCESVHPRLVLTKDSGSFRDQSDANQTAGAIIEAFVPLAVTLGRLSKNVSLPNPVPDNCQPECTGDKQNQMKETSQTGLVPTTATPVLHASGRALYIGLNAILSEEPVNVLLLVEERNHAAFAPMTIEALVVDHFEPIVSNDTTRALGESGVLSMAFAVPPSRSDLFGKNNLTWLRLTPKASVNGEWLPALRGAYLNAVWASATETLTRELLGSSDGAPNMVVRLARPPVLYATLELRVKEPLDEEERTRLRKPDAHIVLSEVEGLPGDWVMWKQVPDPNDEPADARVYALDESNGEIRFGDGQHGLIPPIGRDSIVAFRYKRTEPGPTGNTSVPGNLITARTALNLVSPVATVESVTAADQAAGGAPPEDDERVLRFGYSRLRHRNRAVTLQDIEDLTLESSPDIAQALAVARQGYVRLVVVMSGKNPTPNAAQRRELHNYLLDLAPTSLSATNALRIAGPGIRRLRLELTLRVTSLDKAGALGIWVKEKLQHFFDSSSGGLDKDGWHLGATPSEDDIAFALLDAPDLESIKNVTLYEIAADDREQPWPALLKPTELAMLDKDPLRIHFETDEVMI